MADLRPVHYSMTGRSRRPYKMDSVKAPPELVKTLTNIALSIWADCCNANQPFQSALLAVYLSGLQHGKHLGGTNGQ